MDKPTDTLTLEPKYVKLNKQKRDFINAWLDPTSPTYGNAYQSALASGYSESYARTITTDSRNAEWIQQAKGILKQFTPMHVIQGFMHEATTAKASRDRQNALTNIAKINGMFIERRESDIRVNFTNSVPRPMRPVIDTDPA